MTTSYFKSTSQQCSPLLLTMMMMVMMMAFAQPATLLNVCICQFTVSLATLVQDEQLWTAACLPGVYSVCSTISSHRIAEYGTLIHSMLGDLMVLAAACGAMQRVILGCSLEWTPAGAASSSPPIPAVRRSLSHPPASPGPCAVTLTNTSSSTRSASAEHPIILCH